jgi:hypothetical protein
VTARAFAVGCLLALAALGLCAEPPTPPGASVAQLPPAGFLGVWRLGGPAKVYVGAQLYDYIDGGAEVFFELGFDRVTVQRYQAGGDELAVELYTMRDAVAALGIYLSKCGQETPAPDLADRHTAGRHQLMLVRDRTFLVVDNLSGKSERAPTLVDFAREVVKALPTTQPTAVFAALPAAGLVEGSQRVVRGPLALQSFILLGDGDVLRLGGTITAVAARYTGGALGARTLIVVPYPDAISATGALAYLTAHLDSEIKPLASSATRLAFRDYSGTFGTVPVVGGSLELVLGLAADPSP